MEKRKVRRKTGELKVTSDAESTVSTRSSNSSNSSTSWKQKQRRLKAQRLTSHDDSVEHNKDASTQFKSLECKLGAILETTEVQMVMILLIALDIGCTALEIHLHDQLQVQQFNSKSATADPSSEVIVPLLVRIMTRLVQSFTGFTLFLFLIELAVLLAAFRHKFFAHAGYVLDLAVVSVSLIVELYAQTKAARLLGILRVWRVLRLVRGLVDQERAAHDTTRQLLEQEQLKLLHVRMQKDAAHESLKREYESRAGLEQLLRSYKDEIVTLKEALQIAAQAVAEATVAGNPPMDHEYAAYAVADSEYSEEYYHPEVAVHPTEPWQESDESGYYYQEAAAMNPSEVQEVVEEQWQEEHMETPVNQSEEQIETRSESEFEDAADE